MNLGPIVVHQFTNALDRELIETHVFQQDDQLLAWLESQEVTVYLEFEPREELIGSTTCDMAEVEHPGFPCAHPPMQVDPLDICPGCGLLVPDFAWEGFEAANGQRGHHACVKTERWDSIHNRPADIYTPPEDVMLRIVTP